MAVKVKLVGPSTTGTPTFQSLITYLVDDTLAVDAGALGCVSPLADQRKIRHVLLTHAHQDHIASLPIFLENVHQRGGKPVIVYGNRHTLATLRKSMFNGTVWPDLEKLSIDGEPYVRFQPVKPLEPFAVESCRVTPVKLNHTIPTFGYIIEDVKRKSSRSAIAVVSDTGPTKEIWRELYRLRKPTLVLLDLSFPDGERELAKLSKHLTPSLFRREMEKVPPSTRVLAVHLKPAHREPIEQEFAALKLPNAEVAQLETWYDANQRMKDEG